MVLDPSPPPLHDMMYSCVWCDSLWITAVRSIVPTWHDVFLCLTWLIYIHKCGNASALWIRQCAALYLHDMMHLLCLTWLTYIYKYGNASALWMRQCAALYIHDMMHSCVWRELYIFTDVATHRHFGYGSAQHCTYMTWCIPVSDVSCIYLQMWQRIDALDVAARISEVSDDPQVIPLPDHVAAYPR